MKKLSAMLLVLSFINISYAQVAQPTSPSFPPVQWSSKDATTLVTIENGTGSLISVQITVDKSDITGANISIKNCGSTTRIEAGSSAICTTSDASNPITFSSSSTIPLTGTYQISKQ